MSDEVKAPAPVERRVAALERAFEERNLIPAGFIDDFAHIAQEDWVPANGARVVARAWTDPDFKRRLLENGRAAVAELGFTMPEHHKHLVVLENTPNLQNVICCTLCSCTAFTIIGLTPGWYKDFEYRSRVVRQSRTVLREMGLDLPDAVEIKVWDTTTDTRYMVLPVQPPQTVGWPEDKLAEIVTKESMIGVARLETQYRWAGGPRMDGVHDLGGKQGFGPVRYASSRAAFKAAWEPRANALYSLGVRLGLVNMDEYRHAIERMEPRHYLSASYYERSLTGFATLCVEKGIVSQEELERLAEGSFPLSMPSAEGRLNAMPRESFAVGDRVRVKNEFVSGHVRMPGYIRGKTGVVVGISPPYPFPDASAHNLQSQDERTYDVSFRTEGLWPQAADQATVHVGVFESYLEWAP